MASARVAFKGIDRLREQIVAFNNPAFRTGLSQVLAAAALKQLADEFKHERDPYGKPWAPLKLRKGKILRDTGRMAASAAVAPGPGGFTLSITASYAGTHQEGKTIVPVRAKALRWRVGKRWYTAQRVVVPRRQMLPEASTGGWGPIWWPAFQRETKRYVARHFQGKTP